jgi:hypothetical protein
MRRLRDQFHIIEQRAFRWSQARVVELALENGIYALIGGSLNTQEVGVAVQSIWAPVQVRNVAGDHLLVAAREVTFGEMNRI